MKKFSKKNALLFAAVMALAAFAMPSMAFAGVWTPAGSHTITSPVLTLTIPGIGGGLQCHAQFVVDADGTQILTVTSAAFTGCVGTGGATTCTVAATAVSSPMWSANNTNVSAIQIFNVNVNVHYAATTTCAYGGATVNVAGTLTTHEPFNNTAHSLNLTGSTGLLATLAGSALGAASVTGILTDTAGTLTLS